MNVSYMLGMTSLRIVVVLLFATALTAQEPAPVPITDPIAEYMNRHLGHGAISIDKDPNGSLCSHVSGSGKLLPAGGILERFTLPGRKGHKLPKLLFIRNWADTWLSLVSDNESQREGKWYVYVCDEDGRWHRNSSDGAYFGAEIEGIDDSGKYNRYLEMYIGIRPDTVVSFSFRAGKIEVDKRTTYPEDRPEGFREFSRPNSEWITVADYVSQPHPKWHQNEVPTEEEPLAELIKHTKVFPLDYLQKWFAAASAGKSPAKPKK